MDARELQQYERFKDEAQVLRMHCRDLEQELRVSGPELYRAYQRIDRLEQANRKYRDENKRLRQKLADLSEKLKRKPKSAAPAFVKTNVPDKRAKTPGRKKGHPAALRPMPAKIDIREQVNVPIDTLGKPCCPECRTQLSEVQHHERVVEDFIPAQVLTTCYHTTSGWCPCCRKSVESRAENQ